VTKSRILIAEDEPNLREVLHMQLDLEGFDVIEARDGLEAIEQAERTHPDVILLDVMMPRMDGFETLQRLRASYATCHIPIIMLTAKSAKEDLLTGFGGGANDYLTKPYLREELLLRVNNQLRWSRQQRAANPLTGLPATSRSTRRSSGGWPRARPSR
jgi:two-component system response regulator MprA